MKKILFALAPGCTTQAAVGPQPEPPRPGLENPVITQEEPGPVPGGYIQFCTDNPSSELC